MRSWGSEIYFLGIELAEHSLFILTFAMVKSTGNCATINNFTATYFFRTFSTLFLVFLTKYEIEQSVGEKPSKAKE